MSYWLREAAGWVLLAAGLATFGLVYDFLLKRRLFEAGPLLVVGIVVFRGGVHLLKVALAVRAARESPSAAAPPRRAFPTVTPRVAATDLGRVVPGPQPRKK